MPTTFTVQSEEGSLSVDHAHLDGLESKELIGYLEGYMEETRASMASIKSTRQVGTTYCHWPYLSVALVSLQEEEGGGRGEECGVRVLPEDAGRTGVDS